MIFKEKDSLEDQFQNLEQALREAAPGQERQRREKELAIARAGLKGEQEAAYHINFHLKDNPNWAVIHDLRVEWNGRVAQIDHLLIDRFLEIYVVESKSFRTKIRHANGGWERLNFNHWEGIPCPMEQNQRHILVLEQLIRETHMAPTRAGVVLRPNFFNVVVVQPSCSIIGDLPDNACIYRMDKLVGKIRAMDPSPLDLWKVVSPETVHTFAVDLLGHHRPASQRVVTQPKADFAPVQGDLLRATEPKPGPEKCGGDGAITGTLEAYRYQPAGMPARPVVHGQNEGLPPKCQSCGGPLTSAEANYCRAHSARFAAQLLCRKCQGYAPKLESKPVENLNSGGPEIAARCASCGSGVDKKVVAFCRFNSKRFAGRILCRACQGSC